MPFVSTREHEWLRSTVPVASPGMTGADAEPGGYHELADLLRARILSGELAPGDLMPSESALMQTFGLSRPTVRRAIRELATEGLVIVRHGYRSRVRGGEERQRVRVPRGATITLRMPTPAERRELKIGLGVPVAVVEFGGRATVYAGDRVVLTTA